MKMCVCKVPRKARQCVATGKMELVLHARVKGITHVYSLGEVPDAMRALSGFRFVKVWNAPGAGVIEHTFRESIEAARPVLAAIK